MQISPFCRLSSILPLAGLLLATAAACAATDEPPGFTRLFNGKDLKGWHGMPHFDPYVLAAMPAAERKTKIAAWTGRRPAALDRRGRRVGQ